MRYIREHGGPDAAGVPLHDFSTNANACGPCPTALAALRRADAVRYPDPQYVQLRSALARFHGVAPERVLLAASASEFIGRITAAVARHGGRTASLPAQHYGDYAQAAQAWQLAQASARQADLVWCCDPSSPLGQPQDGLAATIDALADGATAVLDLAYEPLRLQGRLALGAAQRDRLWQLWTPNKALGLTGVRGAYAIAPAPVTAQARAAAAAVLQSWTTPATQAWLAASRDTLRAWRLQQIALCEFVLGWACEPEQCQLPLRTAGFRRTGAAGRAAAPPRHQAARCDVVRPARRGAAGGAAAGRAGGALRGGFFAGIGLSRPQARSCDGQPSVAAATMPA